MEEEILALALRPRRLSDLIGQNVTVTSLRKRMVERPPKALLLTGPTGTGKTSLARIIATSLQCTHQKMWGDPCADCLGGDWSAAVHEINASKTNGVDELEKVAEFSHFKPIPPAQARVIILDEAQSISKPAQQLMLKELEDTPKTTTWVICSTDPAKLLPTLKRRCAAYTLRGFQSSEIEVLLTKAAKVTKCDRALKPLVEALIQNQVNSPALMLMAFEEYTTGTSPEQSIAASEAASLETFEICKAVTAGKTITLRQLLQKVEAEESRWVRASVAGWLKGCLLREREPKRLKVIAEGLLELCSGMAPLEDKVLLGWLVATLYNITRRFALEAKQ